MCFTSFAFYSLSYPWKEPFQNRFESVVQMFIVLPFTKVQFFSFSWISLDKGVQQGSIHGESKQSQARKAIIRMLGEINWPLRMYIWINYEWTITVYVVYDIIRVLRMKWKFDRMWYHQFGKDATIIQNQHLNYCWRLTHLCWMLCDVEFNAIYGILWYIYYGNIYMYFTGFLVRCLFINKFVSLPVQNRNTFITAWLELLVLFEHHDLLVSILWFLGKRLLFMIL